MKPLLLTRPNSTDIFVRGQTAQGLAALDELIRHQERVEMLCELVVRPIVIAFHRGVPQRSIHAFDLSVGPRMVGSGETMVDTVFAAEAIKEMRGQQERSGRCDSGGMTELVAIGMGGPSHPR